MEIVHTKISRKEASKLLKLSIRTVDRYIKAGKLSTIEEDGRIWLIKEEIERFESVDRVDIVDRHLSTPLSIDKVDRVDTKMSTLSTVDNDVKILKNKQRQGRERALDFYKKLYEELKLELKEKQERLEVANYRVGQLENQVRNSIPLLEYHQQKTEKIHLDQQLNQQQNLISQLTRQIRETSFKKRIFLAILLTLLALQPLWILLLNQFE